MILYGAAYYPEHRDPRRWNYDLDRMVEARVNCLRVGEFAWTRFEPRHGEYRFDWMDDYCERAARRGIRLLMSPPWRTAPAWLVEQDPTILIEREDGVHLEYGSRYTFCINHPLLRGRGAFLAEALARHYGPNPNIAGWHLDNEQGDEPDCHCPLCRAQFQEWCRQRYGDIETLNRSWGQVFWNLEFQHFGQIPTPRVSKTFHSPAHLLAWRRFRSAATVAGITLQADAIRSHLGAGQFITTNFQTWNPRTDYYTAAQTLDVCGTNFYPAYGARQAPDPLQIWHTAAMRGFKERNFQVHELRNGPHQIPGEAGNTPAPGEVEKVTLSCVANGADALFYFRWRACPFGAEQSHGTITDYDGRPKRIFGEIQRVGQRLERLSELLSGTTVHSEAAVLYDFDTRWVMETGVRWNGLRELYGTHCQRVYAALRRQRINADVVGRAADFSRYRLLVVPALAVVDDALAEKLVHYVEAGGTLVWHPLSGLKDLDTNIYPDRLHPRLKELLGVNIAEFATAGPGEKLPFTWHGRRYAGEYFCDLPVLEGASADGEFVEAWFAGTPAIAGRAQGAGRVVYVMSFASPEFYSDLFAELCAQAGMRALLPGPLPECVEVSERSAGNRRLLFLINHSDQPQEMALPQAWADLYNETPPAAHLTLPPFGVAILAIAASSQ